MRDGRIIHGAMGGARGDHEHSSVSPCFGVVCSPVSAAGVIDLVCFNDSILVVHHIYYAESIVKVCW